MTKEGIIKSLLEQVGYLEEENIKIDRDVVNRDWGRLAEGILISINEAKLIVQLLSSEASEKQNTNRSPSINMQLPPGVSVVEVRCKNPEGLIIGSFVINEKKDEQ